MLSHSWTTSFTDYYGQEFINFNRRLDAQIDDLSNIEINGV